MQVVIDISNYDKEWITNGYHIPEEINLRISEAIINGTVLPEGHGRLIDADKCIDGLSRAVPYFIEDVSSQAYTERLGRAKIEIDDSETIISADDEN